MGYLFPDEPNWRRADAAKRGASAPPSQNLLTNSKWSGGGAAPTSWTQPANTGTSVVDGTIDGNTVYRQAATAQRPFFQASPAYALVPAAAVTTSIHLGAINSGAPLLRDFLTWSATPAGATVSYAVDGVAGTPMTPATANTRISCTMTTTTTGGNSSPRFGLGTTGSITADVIVSRPMLNTGASALPYERT